MASMVQAGSREGENRPYPPRRAKRGETQSVRVEENRDRGDSARGLTLAEESAKRMKKIGRRKVVRRRRDSFGQSRWKEEGRTEITTSEKKSFGQSHRKEERNKYVKI